MGITAAVLGALGGIAAILGVLDILEVTSERLIHANLSWVFWMYAAIILILSAIAFLLVRKPNYED